MSKKYKVVVKQAPEPEKQVPVEVLAQSIREIAEFGRQIERSSLKTDALVI